MVKTYFRYLTEEDRVRCQINVEKGNVESFVIQYEILIGNQWSPVTRFDTFHEGVHRDLIEPGGKVMKKWFLHLGFDEGLTFAYNDIEKNWDRYRQRYLSQVGEKVMRKEDLFVKNHILGIEFDRYLMENPEILDQIPDNAEVFFLPEDDPDLSMENKRLAGIHKAGGKPVVLVKIGRLSPLRSRLEDVRLESFSI